jgi:periplasmic protein TonB
MKTQETTTPQMDEIVFEKRNKMYGAYILRKMYNKQLNKALLFSILILIAGLAYPLVSSFRAIGHGHYVSNNGDATYIANIKPHTDLPELPKLQTLPDIPKNIIFVAPTITNEVVPDDGGFLPMEEINRTSTNVFVDIAPETSREKQPIIIDVPEDKQETFINTEEMPFFPGGDAERLRFLGDNIQYPQQASELGIQGTVYLQFVVDSKGNITDVKILRGIGGGCEDEALRVIKMMPQWHPGKQNGKAVRVLYTMPVSFKLQG